MTRIAIITGASSGIGAAAAAQFIEQNFEVINVSRRPCPVPGVRDVCGDLSEPAALTELTHTCLLYTSDAADE